MRIAARLFRMALALLPVVAAAAAAQAPAERALGAVDLSADGQLVVYVEHWKEGGRYVRSDLRAVKPDGAGNRVLATGAFITGVTVSPDGKSVVFVHVGKDATDLWFSNADATGLRQLTRTPEAERSPRFSRDGTAVLFAREKDPGGDSGGYRLDLATGQERQVLAPAYRVEEVGPLPEGASWYAITAPVDASGKPAAGLSFKKVLIRVPFDGTAPAPLLPSLTETVSGYQAGAGWQLVQVGGGVPKPHFVESGALKPAAPGRLARVSADGKRGVGTELDPKLRPYVAYYDLEKNLRRPISGAALEDLQPKAVDAAELRKALRALIDAGADDFKAVRAAEGRKLGSRTLYACSVAVPGAAKVEVSIPDRPSSFSRPEAAAEIFRGEDVEVARARYAEWGGLVRAALPDWKASESKSEVAGDAHWNTVFTNGGAVEVRVHHVNDSVLKAITTLRITRLEKAPEAPAPEPAPRAAAGPLGRSLRALIEGTRDGFKSIRTGEPRSIVEGQKNYRSSVDLKGFDPVDLAVPDAPGDLKPPIASARAALQGARAAAKARFDQAVAEVKAALPGWTYKEDVTDQGGSYSLRGNFRKAGAPAIVQVNLFHSIRLDGGSLTLYVFGQ